MELRTAHGLGRIWADPGSTQQYYPLLHSAFWLEHRLWGDAVLGYHLANVLLHVVAALLVVAVMRRLALPGAWWGGFLFALHPVCVESVAWISEQKNTLSAVFCLGALFVYLGFDRDRRNLRYYLASVLFLLALGSKAVTATLPAALLVIFWWKRGRLDLRRDVLPLAPWFLAAAAAGLFSAWTERVMIGAQGAGFALTAAQRCVVAGRAIWFYLGKLAWPADLSFIYPRWELGAGWSWQLLSPAVAVLAVAVLAWIARKNRGPLAGFLLFAGTLFPVLGFLNVYPFRFSFVADHFQYLACLGILVPLAAALAGLVSALPAVQRRVCGLLAAAFLSGLGLLSWRQSGFYKDGESLYRETLARNPGCWMAHNNLGNILSDDPRRLNEAVAEFETALRLRPDFPEAHFNLANMLAAMPGCRAAAIAHYEAALRARWDYPEACNNLGKVLSEAPEGRSAAAAQFEKAVRLNPAFSEAHNNLGVALRKMPGRQAEAMAHLEIALRIRPDFAEAHFNLGNALAARPGPAPAAIAEYEAALRFKPDYAEAHLNCGSVMLREPGNRAAALRHFEAALKLRPGWKPAQTMIDRLNSSR